jgi:hypothetical protein
MFSGDRHMTEHSPLPWELIEATEHHGAYIVNSWGRTVCDLYAMSNPMAASVRNGGNSYPVHFYDMAANAAFIVRAVNNHDALVKALHESAADIVGNCKNPDDPYIAEALRRIGDVLAAVEGARDA